MLSHVCRLVTTNKESNQRKSKMELVTGLLVGLLIIILLSIGFVLSYVAVALGIMTFSSMEEPWNQS